MNRHEKYFLVLAGIFFAALVMANILGITKFWDFFGILVPIGIIPYPITFLATDLISELYGEERAKFVVLTGFGLNVFLLLICFLADIAPPASAWLETVEPGREDTYSYVFSLMWRGTIASMIAYLTAQWFDVKIFHWIKQKTHGKRLWLRNNGSTMISQLIDTTAVISITFIGSVPLIQIAEFILYAYLFKLMVAITDTPFFYLGVNLSRKYIIQDQ